ncbi:DUF2075 domain-containing protein [Corynebacterium senegalense]|uniref:DUF2075 domain-containing protein n=1 Tax=Corynebacterium senegalense TaxID=2080750 RepID=UPI000E1FE7C7|nr:DUF2075 domain-containing protein [Corynebacterium senegalense]
MTYLRMTGREFHEAVVDSESLVNRMLSNLLEEHRQIVGPSEQQSWRNSLPVLAEDIAAAGLEGIDVFLEYGLPLTSQRVDAVLAGTNPRTGDPSFVVVELKQWSSAKSYEDDENLVVVPGTPDPRIHPVRQVGGYSRYLVNYLAALEENSEWVNAVAYLHGVGDRSAISELVEMEGAELFIGRERDAFRSFLRERLSSEDGSGTGDILVNSAVRPSTKLMSVAADEVRRREQFVLLGNQQLAVDLVRHEVENAHEQNRKRVIVVSGGPGSGKSVVALSLLGELGRSGYSALHATGSRSFTQTMRRVAGYRSRETQSLFKYFNNFTQAQENGIDVLIADEAHRIRETSNNRFTSASNRSDRLQIDELISAARVPVFLLDDKQVVRKGELGSVRDITAYAASQGLDVLHVPLGEQFRCGGSAAYVEWVEQILGLRQGEPAKASIPADDTFEIEVADNPWELEHLLRDKQRQGYTARTAAGYCWRWSDATKHGLINDVVIEDWARPWNNKLERRVGNAPPSALWATQEGGFDQVGCVYTAQGFEFDWAGVIIGPDLVWRNGRFVSQRNHNKDPHFRSRAAVPDKDFDLLVRQIYKVLLTRGMVGTILYSPDAETRSALRMLLN